MNKITKILIGGIGLIFAISVFAFVLDEMGNQGKEAYLQDREVQIEATRASVTDKEVIRTGWMYNPDVFTEEFYLNPAEPVWGVLAGEVLRVGQKVSVFEDDAEKGFSLVSYTDSESALHVGWVKSNEILEEAEYQQAASPIKITKQYVSKNSIGVPVVNITIQNNSGKIIDGVRVEVTGVNNFGEIVKKQISGDTKFVGYTQKPVANGTSKTFSWTMNLFDGVTATMATVYELSFTDGGIWTGNVSHTSEGFIDKLTR